MVVTMNREEERMDLEGVRSVAEGAKGRKFGGLLCKHAKRHQRSLGFYLNVTRLSTNR